MTVNAQPWVVTDQKSPLNPDHYPPGKLPALTTSQMQAISQKLGPGQFPSEEELRTVLDERRRATEKIEWVAKSERLDRKDRTLSATATLTATFALESLTVEGLRHKVRQKRAASRPRPRMDDPLNGVLLRRLQSNPTARELWDELGSEGRVGDCDFAIEKDQLRYGLEGEKPRAIAFGAFSTRVSRLKEGRRKRR